MNVVAHISEFNVCAAPAKDSASWSEETWNAREAKLRHAILASTSDAQAYRAVVRHARDVLKFFSSSFFTVTRFLPPAKRAKVEVIYAAVRYPDEVVDTFPLAPAERASRLAWWRAEYERALRLGGIREMVAGGVPAFVAGFVQVARDTGIPDEHYRSFLQAMAMDVFPRTFNTVEDLVDSYVYGSAVVVGYFLTFVYGASEGVRLSDTLSSARHLGIALQLTNFLRDVAEDQRRGRQYLPKDLLEREGITQFDTNDPSQHDAIMRAIRHLGRIAADHYRIAEQTLHTFSPDCRTAIRACIDVYGELNDRILSTPNGISHRESVPFAQKLRVLPASKYWRLPLAYLGLQ